MTEKEKTEILEHLQKLREELYDLTGLVRSLDAVPPSAEQVYRQLIAHEKMHKLYNMGRTWDIAKDFAVHTLLKADPKDIKGLPDWMYTDAKCSDCGERILAYEHYIGLKDGVGVSKCKACVMKTNIPPYEPNKPENAAGVKDLPDELTKRPVADSVADEITNAPVPKTWQVLSEFIVKILEEHAKESR